VESAVLSPEKKISRGVVSIYKDHLGRGPTHARTVITPLAAFTTLEGSLTPAEISLAKGGEQDTVREIRRKFQEAMREPITELIEEVTGRKIASFLSDHDTGPDIAVEMAVFEELE
jgi:uncharacterized protein YbcI